MTRMLVVDDEIDVCDFVKHFFEKRNYLVFTALSGSEALRILRKEKPDIVLLDIRMREMDGVETLRRIRGIDKDVKVIMVTAVEDREKVDAVNQLGISGYITKPLVLEELESTVTSYAKAGGNV